MAQQLAQQQSASDKKLTELAHSHTEQESDLSGLVWWLDRVEDLLPDTEIRMMGEM